MSPLMFWYISGTILNARSTRTTRDTRLMSLPATPWAISKSRFESLYRKMTATFRTRFRA